MLTLSMPCDALMSRKHKKPQNLRGHLYDNCSPSRRPQQRDPLRSSAGATIILTTNCNFLQSTWSFKEHRGRTYQIPTPDLLMSWASCHGHHSGGDRQENTMDIS